MINADDSQEPHEADEMANTGRAREVSENAFDCVY